MLRSVVALLNRPKVAPPVAATPRHIPMYGVKDAEEANTLIYQYARQHIALRRSVASLIGTTDPVERIEFGRILRLMKRIEFVLSDLTGVHQLVLMDYLEDEWCPSYEGTPLNLDLNAL